MLWAAATLTLTIGIKGVGFIAQIAHTPPAPPSQTRGFRLPQVSVMVPLLHEQEIAGALIKRLEKLTYSKSLLEIVLVLEASDTITHATISRTQLPDWIRVIEVPVAKGLTTKLRALNYALDFCRGSIVGVWDAEDAHKPDQIEKVVTRFDQSPDNVVCLQGVLDFYNPSENWISRCFTIEYATWWRVVLPGIANLGFVIPLGGITLFFKRNALEQLGRWDAHNVTKDADLGVRLARHSYVTELIPTVTYEEENCQPWHWVRQRFMGLQMIFLATFSQFAFTPVLWSF